MVQEKENSPYLLGMYYNKSRRHTVVIRLLFLKVKQNKKERFFFFFLKRSRKEEASAGRRISFNLKGKDLFTINVELYFLNRSLLMIDNLNK